MVRALLFPGGMKTFQTSVLAVLCACGPTSMLEAREDEQVVTDEDFALVAPAATCSAAKLADILALATPTQPGVEVDCSFTVPAPPATITKRLKFTGPHANGVVVNCNGGAVTPTQAGDVTVAIASTLSGTTWQRPESITIKNCTLTGSTRVWGMGRNGQAIPVRDSSYSAGHTGRAQAAAPRNITFQNVKLIGQQSTPLYLGPGVTYVKVLSSEVTGVSNSIGVYLDAESGHNTFRDTYFHVTTQDRDREQVALDGSADNLFVSNRFSAINHGGVYLYRNCGEGGTIRHQAPQRNDFIGNVFIYVESLGIFNPAVHVGSRNLIWPFLGWCGLDEPPHTAQLFPFGSALSNFDFAQGNVLAQNQVLVRDPDLVFRMDDSPNFKFVNESVPVAHALVPGCVLRTFDARTVYLRDGETFVTRTDGNVALAARYRCSNNTLTVQPNLPTTQVSFQCSAANTNKGCSTPIACPAGKRLVGLRAACSLHATSMDAAAVTATPWDQVRVVKAAPFVVNGTCAVGNVSLHDGSENLKALLGRAASSSASCSEVVFGGGDCVVRGEASCL